MLIFKNILLCIIEIPGVRNYSLEIFRNLNKFELSIKGEIKIRNLDENKWKSIDGNIQNCYFEKKILLGDNFLNPKIRNEQLMDGILEIEMEIEIKN